MSENQQSFLHESLAISFFLLDKDLVDLVDSLFLFQIPKSSQSVPEKLSEYYLAAGNPRFLPPRRTPGKENQALRLKVKSPDLAETSFTMSTIEEEMEGVNIGQTSSQEILAGSTSTTN